MGKKIRILLNKSARDEKGQALILVLVLLLVGGLIITPLLAYMGTGIRTGLVFEQKTDELYAADAGIEDGLWQIKYENVATLTDPVAGTYDEYDYTTVWEYVLTDEEDEAVEVNDETVSVTIKNEWMPKIDGVNPSDPFYFPDRARAIIEGSGDDPPKLRINGSLSGTSEYRIRIDYASEEGEDLIVHSIGIWLPAGFSYDVTKESNLENLGYAAPSVEPYAGGEAVIWSFSPSVSFGDFPPAGNPESALITFEYTAESDRRLEAVSWIDTTNVGLGDPIYFSWDADTKVYAVTSSAGNTTIESNIYMSGRYSSLLDNAITSPNDIELGSNTFVDGDVQFNGTLTQQPGSVITGEEITGEIDWPDTEEWRQFYLDDVTGAPDPGSTVDVKNYDYDNPLGPWYREGDLQINNTGSQTTVPLGGTIYVTGDLEFKQPGEPKAYTIDLDYNTIFVEGSITFPAARVGIRGSGCIIAIGDIDFQPVMESEPGDFVFICSLTGTVNFHPQGDFYGSIAGGTSCNLQPSTSITWTAPPGQLNLPGMGGHGTGGFGSSVTKYTWKIE